METLQSFMVQDQKAIVLVIHGSGEHIGRYRHVAEWLNQHEFSMIGGDLPGLGTAKGKRGHIDNFNDYLVKVKDWIQYIKEKWSNVPVFLFGHSLGGLIVLRYMQENKEDDFLSGTIVTSPAVSIGIEIPNWQLSTAKLLEKIWPTFKLKSGIQPDQVSRDKEIVEKYAKDPLVYSKVSIRWFFEFQKAIEIVWERAEILKETKLLYMQAGADQLVNPEKAKEFVEKVNSKDLIYHHIPNLYHEILNEPEKEKYLKLLTDWISSRIENKQ